jgi:hypothetical protein
MDVTRRVLFLVLAQIAFAILATVLFFIRGDWVGVAIGVFLVAIGIWPLQQARSSEAGARELLEAHRKLYSTRRSVVFGRVGFVFLGGMFVIWIALGEWLSALGVGACVGFFVTRRRLIDTIPEEN